MDELMWDPAVVRLMATFAVLAVLAVVWAIVSANENGVALYHKGKVEVCADLYDWGMRWHLRLIAEVNPLLAARVQLRITERQYDRMVTAWVELLSWIRMAETRGTMPVEKRQLASRLRGVLPTMCEELRAAHTRLNDLIKIMAIA